VRRSAAKEVVTEAIVGEGPAGCEGGGKESSRKRWVRWGCHGWGRLCDWEMEDELIRV